jgi:hypothetical protein
MRVTWICSIVQLLGAAVLPGKYHSALPKLNLRKEQHEHRIAEQDSAAAVDEPTFASKRGSNTACMLCVL